MEPDKNNKIVKRYSSGIALGAVILGWLIGVGQTNSTVALFSLALIGYGIYHGYKVLKNHHLNNKPAKINKGVAWFSVIAGSLLLIFNIGFIILLLSK